MLTCVLGKEGWWCLGFKGVQCRLPWGIFSVIPIAISCTWKAGGDRGMKCAFQERCCKGPRISYLWQEGFYRLQQTAEAESWPFLHWHIDPPWSCAGMLPLEQLGGSPGSCFLQPDVLRHHSATQKIGKDLQESGGSAGHCIPESPRSLSPCSLSRCACSALLHCLSLELLKLKPKRPWADLWGWESPCQGLRQQMSRLGMWASKWRDD